MNESPATYQAVRITDIADWRLIVLISRLGISAWLKHTNPAQNLVTLFEEKWNNDSGILLSRIEEAVYDHPQVLDDFSADIVIVAPNNLWVPSEMAIDDDDPAIDAYCRIYGTQPDDVLVDINGKTACAHSLCKGLTGFLRRTFPGAAVYSHLSVLTRRFSGRIADMPRVYLNVRPSDFDIISFDGKKLLLSATHPWHKLDDIQYHLFNTFDIYGLKPDATQVSVSGVRERKTELVQQLRKSVKYVMMTMVPTVGASANMPIEAALTIGVK